MGKEAFFAQLEELLEQPAGTLKGPELVGSLEGWDSLAVMSFVGMMDENYGLTVAAKDIVACKTVDDLATLVGAA